MSDFERIDSPATAKALADLLNGGARTRPVVVVTIPAGREEPWINVETIASEAGDLADVYLMPTSDISWEFSHRMAEGTQVYGGAGRVYPVGHEWATDLTKSPLRFAFNERDGVHTTQMLISDAFRMAAAAGHTTASHSRDLRDVTGTVKALVAGRALVDVGNLMPATVAEELAIEGVAIDHLLTPGQELSGRYDAATNRLDITGALRPADEALAQFAIGDVTLARVASVEPDSAELLLYPRTSTPAVTVTVRHDDVTTNPFDDLGLVMTVGEVVAVRIAATAPTWALVMNDIDDDEPVLPTPSLLVDGPPWLVEEPDAVVAIEEPLAFAPAPVSLPEPDPGPEPAPELAPELAPTPPAPPAPRPSPAMLGRQHGAPSPAPASGPTSPEAKESTKGLLMKIAGLDAEVAQLKREIVTLKLRSRHEASERDQLRFLLEQAERRSNAAQNELKGAKKRLRKAGNAKPSATSGSGPRFADHEQGFRYLVLTQWATRTPPNEQATLPLGDYVLGPGFLDSLDALEGIKEAKVADVVFEIVAGLAPQIASRDVHRLRTGAGGDDQYRVRGDGAQAMRASLQTDTPSARRIHYWRLPDGRFEFARVSTHDDFTI